MNAPDPEPRRRTITLTGRPPVRIVEDEWPVIARARDWEGEYEVQSGRKWWLYVRQHQDGRALVYGRHATSYRDESDLAAGELLDATPTGLGLAESIRRVGESLGAGEVLIDRCIADLPPEDL